MKRLLAGMWLLPSYVAAVYAQSAPAADAPMEPASTFTITLFVLLFFGGILGYLVFTWWRGRKDEKDG